MVPTPQGSWGIKTQKALSAVPDAYRHPVNVFINVATLHASSLEVPVKLGNPPFQMGKRRAVRSFSTNPSDCWIL